MSQETDAFNVAWTLQSSAWKDVYILSYFLDSVTNNAHVSNNDHIQLSSWFNSN
jgi:hypothetical protein